MAQDDPFAVLIELDPEMAMRLLEGDPVAWEEMGMELRQADPDEYGGTALPEPTAAPAGSGQKLALMQRRLEDGTRLDHPADARSDVNSTNPALDFAKLTTAAGNQVRRRAGIASSGGCRP